MHSKNKRQPSADERRHIERIKRMPCAVCQAPPPSDAHEIKQGQWFTAMPLCRDCHQGSHNGIHGCAHIWAAKRMDELAALNETIRQLMTEK